MYNGGCDMSGLYKKILVPLDGSEFAAQALPHAEQIASCTGAKLIVFQVVEDPGRVLAAPLGAGVAGSSAGVGTIGAGFVSITPSDDVHRQAMDEAKASLDRLAESFHHRHVDAEVGIDSGDPATRIVEYVAANDVDLVVMSTHGRTGLARWAYGSVATKVLQAVSCAVLVVRPAAT